MDVILMERVAKLGQMGEKVRVKDGFARNFLLPRGKAMRATKDNMAKFETQRVQLEARNLERRKEADIIGEKINGLSFVLVRQAGETGVLYGSVAARDVSDIISANGTTISRNQVIINIPIKKIGLHKVPVSLHAEVEVTVTINIARSPEEAERQARGEEVLTREKDNLDDLGLEIGAALAEAGDRVEM